MLKIINIKSISNFTITCEFNNGIEKEIDVLPLLNAHKNLKGIEKLKDKNNFRNAKIGFLGEIYWENIIENSKTNEIWNYDISPEFVYYQNKNTTD